MYWLVLFVSVQLMPVISSVILPHFNCTYTASGSSKSFELDCQAERFQFPTTFNVTAIPKAVKSIAIRCLPTDELARYCAEIGQDFQPIPQLEVLERVHLSGFQSANQSAPPIGKLLDRVRHQIVYLKISNSRIDFVDADLFRGFRSLRHLDFRNNHIRRIAINAFRSLTSSVDSPTKKTELSKLRNLDLGGNALEELDWSVFKPLSRSLNYLDLSCQEPPLKRLKISSSAFELTLVELLLENNDLKRIPKEVLATIKPWRVPVSELENRAAKSNFYNFQGNNLCSESDCSCCEMKDFLAWGKSLHARAPDRSPSVPYTVTFSCGEMMMDDPFAVDFVVFQHCPPN
ncbi:uncharacterized protein LOC129582613 [Paramacrobiotus metropolitanus]|uniref:uncharacterized protein LOC129582613 n=1 Tax=Paramacrobiotus metropolitanus TaxID=2943436 RepID=UPI002445B13D|nr:uncharacterized protein LOC129582613 [Paramacrobiotus metropolitanus]